MRKKPMTKRRKQKEFQRIGDILKNTLKRKKIPVHVQDHHLSDAWNTAVGPIIAGNTSVHKIKGDTLFIKVSTSTWMQQLQFMKHEILEKVKSSMDNQTIKNIYFSIGDVHPTVPKKEQQIPPDGNQHVIKDRDKKIIEKSTESLGDEELRTILKRVMTKEIINRRSRQDKKSP
jgi:hypothetical protein